MPTDRFPRPLRSAAAEGGAPAESADIPDRYKWRLENIFPGTEAWEKSYAAIESALPGLAGFQGTLGASGPGLLTAIEAIHDTRRYQTLQALLNCTNRRLLPDGMGSEDRDGWEREITRLEMQGIK